MQIDLNKPVSELTQEEAIFLGDKAKKNIADSGVQKPYVYQEYPKYIASLNITVSCKEEEEALSKIEKSISKYSDKTVIKEDVKKGS